MSNAKHVGANWDNTWYNAKKWSDRKGTKIDIFILMIIFKLYQDWSQSYKINVVLQMTRLILNSLTTIF